MSLVTIYGGTGIFGTLIAEALLEDPNVRIRIAARRPGRIDPRLPQDRIEPFPVDVHDPVMTRTAAKGAAVLIAACGPFQRFSTAILDAASAERIPYIDLADARKYVSMIRRRPRGIPVFTGMSTTPGLTSFLISRVKDRFEGLHSIRAYLCPGGRAPRGAAAIRALLGSLGKPFQAGTRRVHGWSDPTVIHSADPIGKRATFWVEVPDYDLFPTRFGVSEVVYKVGLDSLAATYSLRLLSLFRRISGVELDRPFVVGGLQKLGSVGQVFGKTESLIRVEVRARGGREGVIQELISTKGGQRLAALPSILVARALLKERNIPPGIRWMEEVVSNTTFREALEGLDVISRVYPVFR